MTWHIYNVHTHICTMTNALSLGTRVMVEREWPQKLFLDQIFAKDMRPNQGSNLPPSEYQSDSTSDSPSGTADWE